MRPISFVSALLACLILGGLGALTIADLFDGPGTARQEFEASTPATPKGASGLKRFVSDARYYVGKRYALKEDFVTWNGLAKLAAFGHSPAENVGLGKGGFLFLLGEGAVEITQGQGRMDDAEKADWTGAFKEAREAFAKEGIVYGFLIGPNKHTIYPDLLPSWLQAAPKAETRTADVMAAAAEAFGPDFNDPRVLLSEARVAAPLVALYHPTDTHWTELGAALAVHDKLNAMGLDVPRPTYEVADLPRSGDLSRMIGQQQRWSAKGPVLPPEWACRDEAGDTIDVITIDPLMPSRFTCGTPSGRAERLVVFHDSFGVSAIPYIAAHFQQVEFIWNDEADPAEAVRLGADYVLHIQVERKMTTTDPTRFLKRPTSNP